MRSAVSAALWASLLISLAAAAQAQERADPIFGYLNPRTGVFTSAGVDAPEGAAARANANVGGTLRITTTFRIRSTIPQDVTFASGAQISVTSGRNTGSVQGSAAVTRNGNVGRATITLPYLFLATRPADMDVSVFVRANHAPGQLTQLVRKIPLPPNGASTVLNIEASL
jgi:hypothetical protein